MNKLRELIEKKSYLEEFINVWNLFTDGDKGLHKFESYVLYVFIMLNKPKTIIEISPNAGYSTFIILSAIENAGYKDELIFFKSYDIENKLSQTINKKISESHFTQFEFIHGNAKEKFIYPEEGIDFLFIDSEHSTTFAEWYKPFLSKCKYFFAHDIEASKELVEIAYLTAGNGEPKVIHDYLESLGHKHSDKKTKYDNQEIFGSWCGEYLAEWINNEDKMFWSYFEQYKTQDIFFQKKQHNPSIFYKN
jgi:predicted O-methyltransferase YrrM